MLRHTLDVVAKAQTREDVLDVGRETIEICKKVGSEIVRVVQQLCKGEPAGAVELKAGIPAKRAGSAVRVSLVSSEHLALRRFERAFKTPQNRHGNDHIAVFIGHIGAAEHVRGRPDLICFIRDVFGFFIPSYISHNEPFVQAK